MIFQKKQLKMISMVIIMSMMVFVVSALFNADFPKTYGATDIIIDNTSAAYVGTWLTSAFQPNYHSTNYAYKASGTGAASATWTPDITAAGDYSVYYWLPEGATDRATNAPFTISYNGGSQTYFVNQQGSGGEWILLGTHNFEAGTNGYVRITDNSDNNYVIADAIKFVAQVTDVIIDNSSAAHVGTWLTSTFNPNHYDTNYAYKASGTGAASVTWTPDITTAGDYSVYYWLPDGGVDRAANAPYTISFNGGSQTYFVNQQVVGGEWIFLGTHHFVEGTSGYVRLSDNTDNNYVIADAIKFVKGSLPPDTGIPTGLTASVPSDILVDLTWQDHSNDETGFTLERKPSSGSLWTVFNLPANTTHWVDNRGLAASTSYDYRIKKKNGTAYSTQITVSTKPSITKSSNVLVSLVGYKPESEKTMILKGTSSAATFDVLDAVSGLTVLSELPLSSMNDPISGAVKTGDFSSLRAEGYYRIKTSDHLYSGLFSVKENLYEETAKLMLKSLNATRFASDRTATREDTGLTIQMGKGWEDAWDNRHWTSYNDTIEPFTLGTSLLESDYSWDNNSFTNDVTGVSDIAEEMKYGLDYLLQIQERNPNGSGQMKFGQIVAAWAPPEHGQSIQVDNVDAADLGGYNKRAEHVISHYQYVNSLAKGARYFYSIGDTTYADTLKVQAIDAWNYMVSYDQQEHVKYAEAPLGDYFRAFPVMNYAHKLLAALELYKLTNQTSYLSTAQAAATRIANSQELKFKWNDQGITGYMLKDDSGTTDIFRHRIQAGIPYYALAQMVNEFPDSADWFKWYSALKIFSEGYVKSFTNQTAYQIMPYGFGIGPRKTNPSSTLNYRYFQGSESGGGNSDGNTKMTALYAAAISYSSIALSDLGLENIAHRHMDWVFGANSYGTPTMAGVGEVKMGSDKYYSHGASVDSWNAMGVMVNGIDGSNSSDAPYWNNGWQTGEVWGPNRAWTELAIATLGQKGKVSATITTGGTAYANSSYSIINRMTGITVHSGTTNGSGQFDSISLNGGGKYKLVAGTYEKEFDLPSGKSVNFTVDRNHSVSIQSITTASHVNASNNFTVDVLLENNGLTNQTFSIKLQAQNATVATTTKSISINSGSSAILSWTVTAGMPDQPYVILATPETKKTDSKSIMGYVN